MYLKATNGPAVLLRDIRYFWNLAVNPEELLACVHLFIQFSNLFGSHSLLERDVGCRDDALKPRSDMRDECHREWGFRGGRSWEKRRQVGSRFSLMNVVGQGICTDSAPQRFWRDFGHRRLRSASARIPRDSKNCGLCGDVGKKWSEKKLRIGTVTPRIGYTLGRSNSIARI